MPRRYQESDLLAALNALKSADDALSRRADGVTYAWLLAESKKLLDLPPDADQGIAEDVADYVTALLASNQTVRRRVVESQAPIRAVNKLILDVIHERFQRRVESLHDDWDLSLQELDEMMERLEGADLIYQLYQSLSAPDQELFELRYWQALSTRETAKRLGLDFSAVATRLFQLKKKVLDRLVGVDG